MTIEELLTRALAERAQDVGADDGLASAVMRRATRRPRWALLTVVGLLVVALVSVTIVTYGTRRSARTGPDPRATGVPVVTRTPDATASVPGLQTSYRIVKGPDGSSAPVESLPIGPSISTLPRVEKRGDRTWFLASSGGHAQPDVSVALPSDVNGARSILPATGGWIVSTVSDSFTGGDTDAACKVLYVTYSGVVTTIVTGAIRSVAVHPSGTEVAWIETTEHPSWTISLVEHEVGGTKELRRVPLSYGAPGSWPYRLLSWTGDVIVASNGAPWSPGGTVTITGATVRAVPSVTAVTAPDASGVVVATADVSGQSCVYAGAIPAPGTEALVCGPLNDVAPLPGGQILASLDDAQGVWTRAVLVDTTARTVSVIDVPDAVARVGIRTTYVEGVSTVLVPDPDKRVWLRWNVAANTVEIAPLPSGATGAISW